MKRFSIPGTRAEFEALIRPHLDALYRTARRMTGCGEAAQDLVQETCLKAYKAFDQYQPGTNFRAWVFRIMVNAFTDQKRRENKATIVSIEPYLLGDEEQPPRDFADPNSDVEAKFIDKSFREAALRALETLSPEVRLVVNLAVFEEASYEEISAILDCPLGTVRSRLSRGRQQLRAQLGAYVRQEAAGRIVGSLLSPTRKANRE